MRRAARPGPLSPRPRSKRLRTACVGACLALSLLPAFSGEPAGAAAGELRLQDAGSEGVPAAFPGFEPGDEIRYALEGDDGLARALRAFWTIRLNDVDGEGGGVFDLTQGFGGFGSARAPETRLVTTARAWIGPHGFPLRLRIDPGRGGADARPDGYTIEYRFEDGGYTKQLQADGLTEDQDVDLVEHPGLEPGVPRGLYLFMPLGVDCLREIVDARLSRRPGRTGPGQPGGGGPGAVGPATGYQAEPPCRGRQIVFANPGLLSLVMPALWEAGTGEHDFAILAPTGIHPAALVRGARTRGGPNVNIFGYGIVDTVLGPEAFGDAEDAFGAFRLSARGERVELDLGDWTESVWRFETPDPVEAVWVDGQGGVARLDLRTGSDQRTPLRIRRLRPSEY